MYEGTENKMENENQKMIQIGDENPGNRISTKVARTLRNMNAGARDIANKAFKELLIAGAFPKVEYKESVGMYNGMSVSYAMIEYSTVWATYTKIIQNKLIANGYEFVLWTNARNSKYIVAVEDAVHNTTEDEVNNSSDRFRTMFG